MPVIKHKALQKELKHLQAPPGVFLIHGEELLVKTALEGLLKVLLPEDARKLGYEPLDGQEGSVSAAIEKVNTYSLMAEPKVVALLDAQIFYSKQDTAAVIERARIALERSETRKAANALLKAMALLGLDFDDLGPETRAAALQLTEAQRRDDAWLTELLAYCRENNLAVSAGGSAADVLQQAVEKGFPPQQYLVVTTDIVDRRRNLYKAMANQGLVIDCSVPKGDRKADRTAQAAVVNDQLNQVLKEVGKQMDPDARSLLMDLSGFNLRAVSNSVRQLASFVGERAAIGVDDVRQVVRKTRQDPIYNFTNAVTDRDRAGALFFANSLLAENFYPLQLLAAMINQIRKLILVKGFTESRGGAVWQSGCHYTVFRDRVIPVVVEHDRNLKETVEGWQKTLATAAPKKGKKKKAKGAGDLMIAPNPKNPYPIYQLFKKADRFTKEELAGCLDLLDKADQRLKSTSLEPWLVLEEVIFEICP